MKKYIIAITLFIISLICIDSAYALSFVDVSSLTYPTSSIWIYPCTEKNVCTSTYDEVNVTRYGVTINNVQYTYPLYLSSKTYSISSNGYKIVFLSENGFVKDNYYSITIYDRGYDYDNSITSDSSFEIGVGVSGGHAGFMYTQPISLNNQSNINLITYYQNNSVRDLQDGITSHTYIFKAPQSGSWFSYTIKPQKDSRYSFFGYDFKYLGSNIDGAVEILSEQNSQLSSQLNEVQEETNKVNDNLTNSDSSEATGDAGSFFEGFTTDTFGLTSIITAPLNLIQNIASSSCTPLTLSLPYINQNVSIPCMTEIYKSYFGSFLTVYQVITFGLVSYWVCIHVFRMVKDFKNPDHDEIEVVEL